MSEYLNPTTLLIILGITAIIIEVILGAALGFELLVLGVIMILGGIVSMLSGSFVAGAVVMVVLLLAYVFFARNLIKKSLSFTTHKTNADSVIGMTGKVIVPITPDEAGQVKVDGEIWRAEADKSIAIGEKVTVKSISGVTIKVEE